MKFMIGYVIAIVTLTMVVDLRKLVTGIVHTVPVVEYFIVVDPNNVLIARAVKKEGCECVLLRITTYFNYYYYS